MWYPISLTNNMSINQKQEALAALQIFLNTPLQVTLNRHLTCVPQETVVALFHSVASTVPAYRDFLAGHAVNTVGIRTFADFRRLPMMTKNDYVLAYPLDERCRHGHLHDNEMIAVSSGSTGNPVAWPRASQHELDIATRFEHIFGQAFDAGSRSTLAVICFALGTWVGGIYTANCCRYLSLKGYPVTLATPGANKDEILRIIREIGSSFDQVVLLGYPPFIKDVIDIGNAHGIDWPRYHIKMAFAGEVFSEEWRNLVCKRAGVDNPHLDTASLYGTADAGVLANETPLSITLRSFFSANPRLARELFGESRLPSLLQYDPLSRFFETHEDTLVVSGDNGVPLVRYHIADKGGIVTYKDMLRFVRDQGVHLDKTLLDQPGSQLPFVYVFGRADFSVSYYGANVYPENVTVGLEQPDIQHWVSGKFVLQALEHSDGGRTLRVTVELLPEVAADEHKTSVIADSIQRELLRLNSEFAHYVPAEFQTPDVVLKPAGDPEYFPAGIKHRYSRR